MEQVTVFADADDDDDDISILSEKSVALNRRKGSTCTNPILVDEEHYYFDVQEITNDNNGGRGGGDHIELPMNPIIVENYSPQATQHTTTATTRRRRSIIRSRSRKSKLAEAIDLTQDDYYDFGQDSKPTKFFKGDSSNSMYEGGGEFDHNNNNTIFLCDICVDEKPISAVFSILGCNHSYCSECVANYVGSKLQENISNISCPVIGCEGKLEPQHCTSILPRQVFDRWGDALCEALILASEKFYCPFKDCSSLLINDSNVVKQSECPHCQRLFCAQCKVPWHSGVSCIEFKALHKDENSNADIQLMKLAKKNEWKRCPKCKFYVQRSSGCLFMRCRCGCTFCYNCGSKGKDHYCSTCRH